MSTNSGHSEKSQNENNFYNRPTGDNLSREDREDKMCRDTEGGNRDRSQSMESLECQVSMFSLHHRGNQEVLKVHKQETQCIKEMTKAMWNSQSLKTSDPNNSSALPSATHLPSRVTEKKGTCGSPCTQCKFSP